jgi:hypothetical protein
MRKDRNEKRTHDPAKPFGSKLREAFCQAYAGKFWGAPEGAFRAAGYKDTKDKKESAEKLLREPDVTARIIFLRERRLEDFEADPLWIAEKRKMIAEAAEKDRDKLAALKDLEKSLSAARKKGGAGAVIIFEGGPDRDK